MAAGPSSDPADQEYLAAHPLRLSGDKAQHRARFQPRPALRQPPDRGKAPPACHPAGSAASTGQTDCLPAIAATDRTARHRYAADRIQPLPGVRRDGIRLARLASPSGNHPDAASPDASHHRPPASKGCRRLRQQKSGNRHPAHRAV